MNRIFIILPILLDTYLCPRKIEDLLYIIHIDCLHRVEDCTSQRDEMLEVLGYELNIVEKKACREVICQGASSALLESG